MLLKVITNLDDIAADYRGAAQGFPEALQRAFRRLATIVHRAADQRLSGPSAAWSYPVPRRTGDLARGMASNASAFDAVIENTVPYAWAVHTGIHPRWPSPPARPRPFLADAAAQTDHVAILGEAVNEAAPA
jgi:hypothetical protein